VQHYLPPLPPYGSHSSLNWQLPFVAVLCLKHMVRLTVAAFGLFAFLCTDASGADNKKELTDKRIVGTWIWRFDDTGQDQSGKPVKGTVESKWIFTESGGVYFTFQFKSLDGATTRKASNGRYVIDPTGNIVVTGDPVLRGEYRIEWIDEKSLMMYNGGSTGPFQKTD